VVSASSGKTTNFEPRESASLSISTIRFTTLARLSARWMGPSWADETFRRRDIIALSLGQMTGGAHATMQDAHDNHFLGCHAVENHMRALHNTAISSPDIGATMLRLHAPESLRL